MRAIWNLLAGLVSLAIVFGLFNGVLWGIQEVYHYRDVKRCEGIELTLNEIKKDVEHYEMAAEYGKLRAEDYETYEKLITEHNALVQEYNALAQSAYRRVWFLPFPVPSRH